MTKRTLTWKEWNEQYNPIYDEDGHLKLASDFTENEWMRIVRERRNWTRFGGKDGVPPYLLAGYSLARDDFAVTENSWRKEEEGAIRVDY